MRYKVKTLQTDVCVIGGGLSGSLAAIKAAGEGVGVLVLEKADTLRSGNAGTGIDHAFSYIPPLHEKVGYTKEMMKADQRQLEMGAFGLQFSALNDFFVDHSYERILGLEEYGLRFRFADSKLPGGFRVVPQFHSIPTSFNFEGRDIKPVLTKEMEKAGVKILNRAFAVELLKTPDGRAAGAVAVDGRSETVYLVRAKTTILATAGGVDRLSRAANGSDFERFHATGQNNGAGKVLALRAGADVLNLEFMLADGSVQWLNWSMSAGAPHGTYWACAQVVDEDGNVVVERGRDHDADDPEYLAKYREQSARYLQQYRQRTERLKKGESLYLDFSRASDEEIEYVKWSLSHEGKCNVLLANMERMGVGFRDIRIPYFYNRHVVAAASCSGVYANTRCETTVENLYAAGNEIAGLGNNSAPEAIVFGIEAGLQAAQKAKGEAHPPEAPPAAAENVLDRIERLYAPKKHPVEWLSLEHALQDIVETYGRTPYTDDKCQTALLLLAGLENEPLAAQTPHEVHRCYDVMFLIETAKAMFYSAMQRTDYLGSPVKHSSASGQTHARKMYGLHKTENGYKVTEYTAD